AALEDHVPALDVAALAQTGPERVPVLRRQLGRADGPRERHRPPPRGPGGGESPASPLGRGRRGRRRRQVRARRASSPRPLAVVLGAQRDQPFFDALVSLWASATAASGVSTRKVMDSTR